MRRATYRLQLHAGFGFADAAAIVPYLARLGVSHVYLSPVLQAAKGSTHGYDVVDPDLASAELGGEAGWRALVATVKDAGLAILLDIVPNHMALAGIENRWWRDVLELGPRSRYAKAFDLDWTDARILLPVLGERYGRALTNGVLGIAKVGERYVVRAHDKHFPMSPASLDLLAKWKFDLDEINGDPLALDTLLEAQHYRLAHWTVAASQLGYRRFFDVTSLVALRMEEPTVLEAAHHRIFGWLDDGSIAGVRVDHVDGLRDPAGYLETLRARAPDAWVVVEKILIGDEQLPPTWRCDGTTGYEHAEWVGRWLVDREGAQKLTEGFAAYTGEPWDVPAARRRARRDVMSDALHAEVERATELAVRACSVSPMCRDFTRDEIRGALVEIFAGYPVYRTYGTDDRERVTVACAAAREAKPELDADLMAFLESALALEVGTAEAQDFGAVVQQLTGPIVAKGDEDTLSYRQVAVLSRCEVGAELEELACTHDALHARLAAGREGALLASSTHDTKRSEDVRARIAAITEAPAVEDWIGRVNLWRQRVDSAWGEVAPDRVFEWAMWQTLVGAWPIDVARAKGYAEKAGREARLRTSWRAVDADYEASRAKWIETVIEVLGDELGAFAERIRARGDANSLALLAIKLCAPGVPDLYQGCELRDGSLVDPDNRRPVDYRLRTAALDGGDVDLDDLSRAKLHVVKSVLAVRRDRPELFTGPYRPLAAGPRGFAFARGDDLVCIARFDGSVQLDGRWLDVLSGRRCHGKIAAGALPVAVLIRA